MTTTIAVAGKGGTGKTTLAALLIRYLTERRPGKSILAVDADANANLNETLGLTVEETISALMEDTKKPGVVPAGMTKDLFVEYRLSKALVETKNHDLLVMGNPQGPGCYCFANDLLKRHLEKLSRNYDYMIVDNEAGLEHLSRRVIPDADLMLVTSDATARGLRSAGRVREIVEKVKITVGRIGLVISLARGGAAAQLDEAVRQSGLELLGEIPYDETVAGFDLAGKPLLELPRDTPAVQAATSLFQSLDL